MPRIYTSENDPLDFCHHCFPSEDRAREQYGDVGNGPNGRGNCFEYDADHPGYAGTGYTCADCGKPLGDRDNYTN
jgi:hypothetical protein